MFGAESSDPAEAVAFFLVVVFMWAGFWGGIGALIARGRGRAWAGFWLGTFLGLIGWLISIFLPRSAEAQARFDAEVRALS